MDKLLMLIVVLLPIFAAPLIPVIPFGNRKQLMWYVEGVTVITSLLVLWMLMNRPNEALVLIQFTERFL